MKKYVIDISIKSNDEFKFKSHKELYDHYLRDINNLLIKYFDKYYIAHRNYRRFLNGSSETKLSIVVRSDEPRSYVNSFIKDLMDLSNEYKFDFSYSADYKSDDTLIQKDNEFIINEDSIKLPVPFGSTVYYYELDCCSLCIKNDFKDKFDELFPPKDYPNGRCDHSYNIPCHTKLHAVYQMKLNLNNIKFIYENWHTRVFETEELAREAGLKVANENLSRIKNLDFDKFKLYKLFI